MCSILHYTAIPHVCLILSCLAVLSRLSPPKRMIVEFVLVWILVTGGIGYAQVPELLYLRFNSGSGLVTNDKAVPGLPGTSIVLAPSISWNSTNPRIGGSCLDTSTGTGLLPMCKTGAPVNYVGDWTIEFWILRTGANGSTLLGTNGTGGPWIVDHGSSAFDKILLDAVNGDPLSINQVGNSSWKHVAIVHDSLELKVSSFVDGVFQGVVSQSNAIPIQGDGASGLLIGGIGGGAWKGLIDEFRIWGRALSQQEIFTGRGSQSNAKSVDAAVIQVTSPVAILGQFPPSLFSASETVTVQVSNLGTTMMPAGTILPMTLSLNGVVLSNESFALPSMLSTGSSTTFTFLQSVDLTGQGRQSLEVSVGFPGDQQPINDAKTRSFRGNQGTLIAQFPFKEDFDALGQGSVPPLGWMQDPGDNLPSPVDVNWDFADGSLLSFPFPSGDHTFGVNGGGNFALVSAPPNSTANLLTPIFDLQGLTNPRLEFWLNNENASTAGQSATSFSIDVLVWPSGSVTLDVFGPIGALSPAVLPWQRQLLNLSPFLGQKVMLRLRAQTAAMSGMQSLAIDDIQLTDHPLGIGQAPQVGFAVLDINGCRSIGGELVAIQDPGPYLARATVGGPLRFRLEGQSNQTTILFFGSLNLVAATFPTIGQIDIGGAIDPLSGIPVGLSVMFDGSNSFGLNPFFVTDAFGVGGLLLNTPNLPIGIVTTFQAAVHNSITGVSLSNAVQLEIE